jgi:putative intracellular protease/amidase
LILKNPLKVLFVITSSDLAVWLSEVTHPYWHLSERGIEIGFASPKGGKVLWDPLSDPFTKGSQEPDDLFSKGFLSDEALVLKLKSTLPLSSLDLSNYDAVHVAGGAGAGMDLYPNKEVAAVLEHFWTNGKAVGAICQGAISLGNIPDRIRGRRVTGYSLEGDRQLEESMGKAFIPNFPQPVLEGTGAKFSCVDPYGIHVVVDGKLVTGQNQQSASEYALALHHVSVGRSPVAVG